MISWLLTCTQQEKLLNETIDLGETIKVENKLQVLKCMQETFCGNNKSSIEYNSPRGLSLQFLTQDLIETREFSSDEDGTTDNNPKMQVQFVMFFYDDADFFYFSKNISYLIYMLSISKKKEKNRRSSRYLSMETSYT